MISGRLLAGRCSYSNVKNSLPKWDLDRLRNIGIVAHIDAGKTTVTERLLYLSGATRFIGDVDSGNTVTDFLDIERERGITVQSAAVAFGWNEHRINLIDTPGHVDFTLEVERSARILDGVVTILDGSAGVQAQTRTVWRQAAKFQIPSVFFINKMDKKNADFHDAVDSIEEKLGIKGLVTVAPVYNNEKICGFVDVLKKTGLNLESKNHQWFPLPPNSPFYEEFLKWNETLCYSLSDCDASFMHYFLEENAGCVESVCEDTLIKALQRVTTNRIGTTVSCGSALRSTESVLPLFAQIIDFLPSPRHSFSESEKVFEDNFSALVFKISHDKRKGQLSHARVYSGALKNNHSLFNSSRCVSDGPVKIFLPQSDDLIPVETVQAGEIVILSGLKNTITGDTLITSEAVMKSILSRNLKSKIVENTCDNVQFSGIDVPDPVYFCCIEPPTNSAVHLFEKALGEIVVEDPSLKVRRDSETGQTVIETMGELHLEVIKDKFVRGYGLNVFIGPLQVAYREMILSSCEHSCTVSDLQGERSRPHSCTLTLEVSPTRSHTPFKNIEVQLDPSRPVLRNEWRKAISEGCANALHNGPILGYPLHAIRIALKEFNVSGGRVNPAIISACAQKCVTQALGKCGVKLTEPIMLVEVSLDVSDGAQPILQEFGNRRGHIISCESDGAKGTVITARLPLSEMDGLSTMVRILSSGLGTLNIQVTDYSVVSEQDEAAIVSKVRGTHR